MILNLSDLELSKRCSVRLERGEYRPLVEEMVAILESRPDFADGFFAAGGARMKLGELGLAAECFAKVTRLTRPQTGVYRFFFLILWELGRKAELQEALDVFLRCDAIGPDADYLRGSWLPKLGRSGEALVHLSRGIAAAPERADLRQILGSSALKVGDNEVAKWALQSVIILAPTIGEGYRLLGVQLERGGDLSEARRVLHRGLILGERRCALPLTRVLKGLNRFGESITLARDTDLDQLHFRSGTEIGTLDRGGIMDFDGYDFPSATDIEAAEEFEPLKPMVAKPDVGRKWHFRAKDIIFFLGQ